MVDLNIELPESFFKEEERANYKVDAKTKEVWAVELDLLNEFDRVCKKYGLKYILDFGTMLGAVRHKGFIPWDDDVDVSMLREDYDKLMEVGPKEFKHPYFLQTQLTDKSYDMDITRLRRSDTTSLNFNDVLYGNKYNQGIFLDIYVFDNVPTNDINAVKKIHNNCKKYAYAMLVMSHTPFTKRNRIKPTVLNTIRYAIYKLRYGNLQKASKHLDIYSKKFEHSDYVCILHCKGNTRIRERKVFENIIEVPYETLMLPIPAAYDEVLTDCFGDYMTPVNFDKGFVLYLDTNRSYEDVIKEEGSYDRLCKELSINPRDYQMGLIDFLKYRIRKKFF